MSNDSDKSKIIIDEDWKTQVQAEKEAAKSGHAPENMPATASSAPIASGSAENQSSIESNSPELPDFDLPPASLVFLCTTLATQAMIALGQVPNPISGKTEPRLKQAKHYIDTLGMLEEKTAGNRTADESALFDDLLHQLRMAYVTMQSEPANKS
ncbi:MAG TPA: DUF1844 domain-containing protein [Pirellulales bacterium]|jgi:hypothetical protein|nr:DUF1844 domain-containing protein [Pirellulales bacterium]